MNLSSGENHKQKEQKVQLKRAQHLNVSHFIMRHKQKKQQLWRRWSPELSLKHLVSLSGSFFQSSAGHKIAPSIEPSREVRYKGRLIKMGFVARLISIILPQACIHVQLDYTPHVYMSTLCSSAAGPSLACTYKYIYAPLTVIIFLSRLPGRQAMSQAPSNGRCLV